MSNIASNTISVLGGAALGAVVTYLLDPDHGVDRRQQILTTANDAVSNASDAVRSTAQEAAGSAKGLAASLTHYAQQLADHVSASAATATDQAKSATDHAHDQLNSSVQSLINQAKDYTADLRSKARARSDDLSDRAKSAVSRQTGWQPSGSSAGAAAGISGGVLGALVLGAGVMFFADPARGHSRRAWAVDKVNSLLSRSSKNASRYGRHVGNQLKGVAHQAKNAVPEDWAGAVDQVKDAVSHAVKSVKDKVE
jgi:gas vesicle protein